MNGSQEQLIELTEIRAKSPSKTKIKRNNKVEQSQCSDSICSTGDESNIISIFSTMDHSLSTRGNEPREPSISLTDSVFAKPGPSGSKRQESGQFYRQKISEHLKKIRQKASISANLQPLKSIQSEERDTPRSVDIIATCSSRFNADKETPEDCGTNLIYYLPPESLNFVIRSTEKDWFFKPKRRWFDTNGDLYFLDAIFKTDAFLPKEIPLDCNLTLYKSPHAQEECEGVQIVKDQILNLYLSELKFSYHSLFSCEHLFAEKLRQMCEEYSKINTKEMKEQLDHLRSEKQRAEEEKNASGDSEDTEVCNVDKEIKKLRTRYFRELEKERRCLKSILEVWRHIKTIREQQGYSSTSVSLKILKKPGDLDTEAYHKEFDTTLREVIHEHKAKEAKDTDSDSMASSVKNDEDKLKQRLTKRFKKVMKQPGEPIVSFILSKEHQITEDVTSVKEKSRRDAVIEQPKALQKKKVCELKVNIPSSNTNDSDLDTLYFEKDEIIHYKHEGLGSGLDLETVADKVKLKVSLENYELKTSGSLLYSIKWEKLYKIKKEISFDDKFMLLNDVVDKDGTVDTVKLKSIAENEDNEQVKKTLLAYTEQEQIQAPRLKAYEELQFCDISKLEQNIRFTLLTLRDKKEIEFDGMLVPNRVKEIPFSILADYKRRKATEEKGYMSEENEYEDEYEAQRKYGKKYLKQVYTKVFQRCKNTENNLEYKSVVNEKFLIRIILKKAINWLKWRPTISNPLPTLAKPTARQKYQTRMVENVHISIHILNGKNLPSRNKYTFNSEGKTENELRPFVRINYKNIWIRSAASKGNYLNPNSLNGYISIDVFDESDYDMKQKHRKRFNWLGGLEGLFKVRLPYILLGYKTEEEKFKTKSPKTTNIQSHQAYLQLEISISPDIPKLSPNMDDLPCGDLPYIKEHIMKWTNNYNYSFPSRSFSALVIDMQCKTLCATRYIQVVEPPQINQEEFDLTPEQCLRFQLLQLLIGSTIDHAIALTCYLLALKMEAWLLLAYGIPHGKTAYVLVKEYNGQTDIPRYYVLDVVFAQKYYTDDPYCPIQNIWANIQKTDGIALTNFNLNRKSDWQQLFTKDLFAPARLTNYMVYKVKDDTKQLEIQLERKIKKQITKLIQLNRTVWNKHISDILKHALKSLEMNCMYNKNFYETISDLHRKLSAYKVYGYAINMPFTSMSDIVKRIKSLDTHLQEDDNEFALALYLHSFPGGILSVWIFFASIEEVNETEV
nr:unnamed protein product [Callosobruchus analis]